MISPTVSSLPLPQIRSGPLLGNQQEGAARTPSSLPLSLHLFSSRTWRLRLGTELGGINRKDSDCFGYPFLDNKLPPKQFIFSLQFCGSSDLGWVVLLCQSCSLAWLHSAGLGWKVDDVFAYKSGTQILLHAVPLCRLGLLTAWQLQNS